MIVETMSGLGDCVYTRPFVRALIAKGEDVYVRTPWPQVFVDLQVKLLPAETELRTQKRNVARGWNWSKVPSGHERVRPHYNWALGKSIPECMGGVKDFSFKSPWRDTAKHLAVVVPPTIRTEWPNRARACDPIYMQQLIDRHRGFDWVELSDICPPAETYYGEPLQGVRHAGELSTTEMIRLLTSAQVIVTGVGFALPLGLALGVPTLCLFGGDIPLRFLVEDWMIKNHFRAVTPAPFCDCGLTARHVDGECNKTLYGVEEAFRHVAFDWSGEYGHWPVHIGNQYDRNYFNNYCRLEKTQMGEQINAFRVQWVNTYFPNTQLLDVGIGSGQFVRSTNALGTDINPVAIEELKYLGRYADMDLVVQAQTMTFWDSLEHIPDLLPLLDKARNVAVSIPIYKSREHALASKHFKPNEHMHYWTHKGFVQFMRIAGFELLAFTDAETKLGREDILTYAFRRMP